MSLTLKAEQKLIAVGLVEFYDDNPNPWQTLARKTYTFMKSQFPSGATVRRDDVAEAMVTLLQVNESLEAFLQENKLKQLYWIRYFADLVLDRTWKTIKQQ